MEQQDPVGVSVEGQGVVTAVPDTARISVGVSVVRRDLPAARAEAARLATAAIAAVEACGIDKQDIRTTRLTISAHRDWSGKSAPATITGYEVSNQVRVTVRDLERTGDVLDAVVAAGANDVSGPEFFIDRPEALQDEARRLAIADARRRAETLADAAGTALGPVLAIAETGRMRPAPRALMQMAAADAPPATPVEAGEQEIAIDVRVRWALA
jgi:uncharacterized protein